MPESRQPTINQLVRPRLKNCVFCRSKLKFKYKQDEKTVYRLDETAEVTRYAYFCPNEECRKTDEVVLGPRQGLKDSSIGWDLITEIGVCRVNDTMILEDIQSWLFNEYKIWISTKQISNIADAYLQLVKSEPHPTVVNNLRSRGNCILSIDGAKPEKANCILYIIREEVSGKILLARTVNSSDTDTLAGLLQEVKDMKLPVVGIVSDKQKSIVNAVKRIFPGIDHQFCQYHFLKNVSKDFKKRDRNLRKEIRKDLKPIYQTFNTATRQVNRGDLTEEQFDILEDFYLSIKASSRKSAKYPFKPVGIELYRNIFHLEIAVKDLQSLQPVNFFNTIIKHTSSIRQKYRTEYNIAKSQFEHICTIEDLLDVDALQKARSNSEFAEQLVKTRKKKLVGYIEGKIDDLTDTSEIDVELHDWWIEVKRLVGTHLDGLFEYCKREDLPRTNNGMEHYIKDLKSDLYHILNRKYIHKFMLRRAEFWVFAKDLDELSNGEIVARIKENGDYMDDDQKERFEKLQNQFRMSRVVRKDFKKAMREIVERWKKEVE